MRMKALGVALMVGFAAFTTFYWITDAPRRDVSAVSDEEELIEFGRVVFLPDDTYTIEVVISDAGFDRAEVELFVNTTISFKNETGDTLTVAGSGQRSFEVQVEDTRSSPVKFDAEGETTVTAAGVSGELAVSAVPPHLEPYGANCARCHGVDGTGGIGPNLHSADLANKWLKTGGPQGLNNYVSWVITLGGVVRSGNIDSVMPAWGIEFGGSLTRQQIEALTAMIGEWAQETIDNPPPPEDVPDTVEAGAEVFASAGCAGCHGANLEGGFGPNLQTIGSSLITTVPPLVTTTLDIEQMQTDYDADMRAFFEQWIRESAFYNGGNATAMPSHPEDTLSESALRALITFLLDQTE